MKDWVKIYETTNPMTAQIVLSMLQSNDIEAVEMNKTDRSYPVFGVAEIYCKPESAIQAIHLIKQQA